MTHVREFHEAFDIPILGSPAIPDIKRVLLRQRLLAEEYHEADDEFQRIIDRWFEYTNAIDVYRDIARLAKELSDVRYVAWGADLEFGIPSGAVDLAVHKSNMSKLGPDGRPVRRHDGKVIKGPNYYEPNILETIGIIEGSTTP
jgi:predicted HAD superfamily Cof-like phosphohydrolase